MVVFRFDCDEVWGYFGVWYGLANFDEDERKYGIIRSLGELISTSIDF